MLRMRITPNGSYQVEVTGLFITPELVEFIKNEINAQPTALGIYYHRIENNKSFKLYLRGVSYEHSLETYVKFSHWLMQKLLEKTQNNK